MNEDERNSESITWYSEAGVESAEFKAPYLLKLRNPSTSEKASWRVVILTLWWVVLQIFRCACAIYTRYHLHIFGRTETSGPKHTARLQNGTMFVFVGHNEYHKHPDLGPSSTCTWRVQVNTPWDRIIAGPAICGFNPEPISISLPFEESSEHCARCDTRAQHLDQNQLLHLNRTCYLQASIHRNAPSKCRTIQLDGPLHLYRTLNISRDWESPFLG